MKAIARIVDKAPQTPVISVDGSFDAPGLNLSHWPGNSTPPGLKHDLSTGIALNFARLSPEERERLRGDAKEVVNNHYDTDGCCAAFAILYPDVALLFEQRLLAVAACGDFYTAVDEDAFCVDMVITNMADPKRSPIARDLEGLDDLARWTAAQNEVLRILPDLCAGALELYRFLWEDELERLIADFSLLDSCTREDDSALDLTVWRHTAGAATEADAHHHCGELHSPGRHALFTRSKADRALFLANVGGGVRVRLVISTLSWFDLQSRKSLPRPDLVDLAARLNSLEGLLDDGVNPRWHAQALSNASPELWFGTQALESFAEHNDILESSALQLGVIEAEIQNALRPIAAET